MVQIAKKINNNFSLKKLTTMKVGGPAKYFFVAKDENNLIESVEWAKENKSKWYIIGDGSNIIPSDNGFNGLVIRNALKGFERIGNKIIVGAGENLLGSISRFNRLGLAGMEKMAGIPGTIGGAIYGCAGAYGQEMSDYLVRVKIYDGQKIRWLSKKQCQFSYRTSIFKIKKNWIILAAEFKFKNGDPGTLQKISKETIKLREKKYWPELLCSGSFFKNVVIQDIKPISLRRNFLLKIPKEKMMYGKVPSGYLLETVGAKGMEVGQIRVAEHHGNLIYNSGNGAMQDIKKLAAVLKMKVSRKFGLKLEEEIQYLQ